MPKKNAVDYDYDLIIIGSGSGGGVAATMAARAGKKVAIFEGDTIGGECPNYGCVPTKALLHSAEIYETGNDGADYGIKGKLLYDYAKVKEWKDLAVYRTGTAHGKETFKGMGIDVISSKAYFISSHEITTGRKRYTARKFLIATGTKNFVPPIKGLEEAGYITYREAIDLNTPPKSLFVIGGGAIGCEFTQLFNIFGAKVHIAEFAPRLLAREDEEVGELVDKVFTKRGIKVHTATKVVEVTTSGKHKIVHFENESGHHTAKVEEVLLATGKVANVDLGLDNAGVEYTKRNIITDDTMQTTAKHIYAAGDVVGPFMFTHTASYQSRIAAHNILHKDKLRARYHAIPRCTFISPEVASVGMSEQDVIEKGTPYKVGTAPISIIGRANTSNKMEGFVKVIANKNTGVLLGASIAAPRAGEMIHELTLAINHKMKAEHIESTVHAFPTWSEAIRIACAKIV